MTWLKLQGILSVEQLRWVQENLPGAEIRIPLRPMIQKKIRNVEIRREFNGHNWSQLARLHKLSIRMIRYILNPKK